MVGPFYGKMNALCLLLACLAIGISEAYVDYTGHKVITINPKTASDLEFLHQLRQNYSIDLWNEPKLLGVPVMSRLKPELINLIESILNKNSIKYSVAYENLQSAIDAERAFHAPTKLMSNGFNFGMYNQYEQILRLLKDLSSRYPKIATLEEVGKTFENRPIYSMKISAGDSSSKPAIVMECGIHAREWSSVAAGAYIVNQLITGYGSDAEITSLVDKYEFNIIVEANPDGYIFSWKQDRLWRKTRSKSKLDWMGVCLGTDANRNFNIEHCGVGTSRRPCEDIFCGDFPFSEGEARAIRDLLIDKKDRLKAYFAIHAFSQLWMTPYGIKKTLPPNYSELTRIGQAGLNALAKRYGTRYRMGSISNIIYEAAGSSVDYAYEKLGIKISFALELRDTGAYGFILPPNQILPMCEETFDGLKGAIQAL